MSSPLLHAYLAAVLQRLNAFPARTLSLDALDGDTELIDAFPAHCHLGSVRELAAAYPLHLRVSSTADKDHDENCEALVTALPGSRPPKAALAPQSRLGRVVRVIGVLEAAPDRTMSLSKLKFGYGAGDLAKLAALFPGVFVLSDKMATLAAPMTALAPVHLLEEALQEQENRPKGPTLEQEIARAVTGPISLYAYVETVLNVLQPSTDNGRMILGFDCTSEVTLPPAFKQLGTVRALAAAFPAVFLVELGVRLVRTASYAPEASRKPHPDDIPATMLGRIVRLVLVVAAFSGRSMPIQGLELLGIGTSEWADMKRLYLGIFLESETHVTLAVPLKKQIPLHTYSDVSADTPRFLDPELESIVHDLEATLGAPIYTAHTRTLAWRITTDRESVAACAVLDKQSVIAIDVDGPPEPLGVDTLQAACVPVLGAPSLVFVWDMVAVAATARRRVLASLRAVLAGPKARSILIHSPERDLARLRSVLEIPVRDKDVVDTQAMAGEWVTWSTEAWRVLGAPPPPLPLVKDSFTAPLPCLEPSVEREPPIERVESWLSTLFCGMSLFGRGDEAVHVEPALVPHESQPLLSDPTDSAFGRSWSSSYGAMTAPSTSRDSDLVISRLAPPVLLLQSHAMRPSLNATLAATRRPYNWCKEVPLGIDHRAVAADRRCVSWTLIDPAKDAASNAEAARFEARVLDVDQMMQAHEHMRESIAFIREWMEGRSSFAATVNGEAGQEQ